MCIRDRYLVALMIVGGQEYYDGVRVLGLYQFAQLKTISIRQVDVQQHQIKFPLADGGGCGCLLYTSTTLGHFKNFLRNGEKGGAAHAAPPIPYGYSIARICSVNERFFKSRISHTERINCKRINISRYPPICIVGN